MPGSIGCREITAGGAGCPGVASASGATKLLQSSIVSSGVCVSERPVKPRMSENITVALRRLPPSAKPDC